MTKYLQVNGKEIWLTNIDRVLWPRENYTKYHLIKYYLDMAPYLLKYLKNRPVVFQRFPQGVDQPGFYQKNCPADAPSWIRTFPLASRKGKKITKYILVDNAETLVWLGNQACVEIHPWLSSLDSLEFPDFAVFDLDPMEKSTFSQVMEVSLLIKTLLEKEGIRCYPKTSGATGLQIFVPLNPVYSYEKVRDFVEYFCRRVHQIHPQTTTLERRLDKREGKIYLDYLQNVRGKTINAPYSVRPLEGAPVSMPLWWNEIQENKISSSSDFNIKNVKDRLEITGDMFEQIVTRKQNIHRILEKVLVKK